MKTYRRQLLFLIFIFIFFSGETTAQVNDTAIQKVDSLLLKDSANFNKTQTFALDSLLKDHKYLNTKTPAVSFATKERTRTGKEFLFYLLGIIILLLALFKVFYSKYFNNIFRVFFNTSLRQNQLTDLLLQAKLPSLIFNIFFVISAGLYAWLLLDYYQVAKETNNYIFIGFTVLFVAAIYSGKFISLKLVGWISGMSTVTDQYIFVIFLINKIIGITLIPFIILLAFAARSILNYIIIISFCVIGILILLRYLRSYGLLQTQLKINVFHFLLYIIGMELLPILLIYKLVNKVLL